MGKHPSRPRVPSAIDDDDMEFPMQYGIGAVYPINDKPARAKSKAANPIGFVHFEDAGRAKPKSPKSVRPKSRRTRRRAR